MVCKRMHRFLLDAIFFWIAAICLFSFPDNLSPENNQSQVRGLRRVTGNKMYESIESVTVRENYAHAGVGRRLMVLNVSNTSAPAEVGSIELSEGMVADVDVAENEAYVAAGGAGLRVMDISEPSNPREISFVNTPGYAEAVTVKGQYAYVGIGLRVEVLAQLPQLNKLSL